MTVEEMWAQFVAADGASRLSSAYRVVEFGDSPELIEDLAALIVAGPKRATTSLARWYREGGEAMPMVGGFGVVVGGNGTARCVVRTTRVEVMPFSRVDEEFAFDEGEGDRTLAWWRAAHRRFFEREAAREEFLFEDEHDVVLERFEVVWPAACTGRTLVRPLG